MAAPKTKKEETQAQATAPVAEEKKLAAVPNEPTAIVTSDEAPPEGSWGNEEPISAKERMLPKLHLMQGQSKLVAEEKAAMGDIVNLVTGQVLGGKDKPIEIIPIMKLPSTWVVNDIVYENGQANKKFKEIIDVTPQNENMEWKEMDGNDRVILERDYCINFLVLVAGDLTLPYQISFRRTSLKAGKKVVNYFDACRVDKVAPARNALSLVSSKLMKDNKPYYVFDLNVAKRKTTDAEYGLAFKWFKAYEKVKPKVDHSDLVEETEVESSVETTKAGEVGDTAQY